MSKEDTYLTTSTGIEINNYIHSMRDGVVLLKPFCPKRQWKDIHMAGESFFAGKNVTTKIPMGIQMPDCDLSS